MECLDSMLQTGDVMPLAFASISSFTSNDTDFEQILEEIIGFGNDDLKEIAANLLDTYAMVHENTFTQDYNYVIQTESGFNI